MMMGQNVMCNHKQMCVWDDHSTWYTRGKAFPACQLIQADRIVHTPPPTHPAFSPSSDGIHA